ncbi:DegT/DnrJ/EryC1/StrS family aminotransferase, partial [Patescibacteria group bacterium]|nr:DegT/DnrJ/EryC1/StrS family aminotransferase [Patescibacteria group bacterium]
MSMFSYFKPISTALLPNAELDDIKIVLKLFLPWNWSKWQEGKEIGELENKFKEYFGVKHAISFSSGRAGLYAIL